MTPRPFEIRFDRKTVDALRQRIRQTLWAPEQQGAEWTFGVPGAELRRLAAYWADGFDFDAHERLLNQQPQFRATVSDVDIHFIHRRGVGPAPIPLVLTHGWPWTFWDFAKVIEPLADPARFGGNPADAFDVIVPALPGYPLSAAPDRSIGFVETADLWRELLDVLGHKRFGAHGGDSGAFVTAQLAHAHADSVIGAHLTFPALLGAQLGDPRERPDLQTHFLTHMFEPQTLSWAMHDSPVGMLAWMLQRRRSWSDCEGDVSRRFTDDELLLATTLYWLGNSFASSVRFYAASFKRPWIPRHNDLPTLRAPTGIAVFPKELRKVTREFASEHANIVHWSEMPRGGHFAASEEPELLIQDLRAFFKPLRDL